MEVGNLSPSKLETSRLCEARLAGRLNQLGEAEWDEEHGEAASTGTLAHAAAKHWYRPCPRWIERMRTRDNRNQLNIVFAERRYKGKLANNVPVHLIVDLGIDRGNGRLELVDYKTGWISISTDDMYSKDQVLMNMLAVSRYDDSLSYFP